MVALGHRRRPKETHPMTAPRARRRLMLAATTSASSPILTFGVARPARALPAADGASRCTRPPTTRSSGSCATSAPTARWLYEYDADRQVVPTTTTSCATPAGHGPVPGGDGADRRRARERRPRARVGARPPRRARRLDGPRRRRGRRSAGSALLTAGLVERRLLTGDDVDDDVLNAPRPLHGRR